MKVPVIIPALVTALLVVHELMMGHHIRALHLDTTRVSGWNEIDAVELIGRDGSRQWATSAKASSSYAGPR